VKANGLVFETEDMPVESRFILTTPDEYTPDVEPPYGPDPELSILTPAK
jgi:hypothetical protein